MRKVLFICNVLSHIYAFHIPYLRYFHDKGYKVHVMANAGEDYNGEIPPYCDYVYNVKIVRSPFSLKNVDALKEAEKIISQEKYDIVHCHTPMGGVIGRLASRSVRKNGSKVLYTAHGFHFYRGAPAINWVLYYTMEKYLAHMTDCIITINKEDYELAIKHFQGKHTTIEYINGIGVNVERFHPITAEKKLALKHQSGYENCFLLIYTAEFIQRKNHQFIIKSLPQLVKKCPNIKVLFAGNGMLFDEMKQLAEAENISQYIDFLGFRKDISMLLQMSDILVSASVEEGFGINVVEGMAVGLPAVVSNVRGHREMICDGVNGFFFNSSSRDEFCNKIVTLYNDKDLYNSFAEAGKKTAQNFSIAHSLGQMERIYEKYEI